MAALGVGLEAGGVEAAHRVSKSLGRGAHLCTRGGMHRGHALGTGIAGVHRGCALQAREKSARVAIAVADERRHAS